MLFMILISVFATAICLCHLRAKKKEEDNANDRKHEIRRSTLQSRKSQADNVQRRKSLEEIKFYNVADNEKEVDSLTENLDDTPNEIKFK
jgi:Tfp pilus assembly protein PilO